MISVLLAFPPLPAGQACWFCQAAEPVKMQHCDTFVLAMGKEKKKLHFLNGLGLGRNLSHGRVSGNEKTGSQIGTVFKKAQQERSINKLQV